MHTLASNVGNVAFNGVDNGVDNGPGVVELPQRVIINNFDVDLNAFW